MGAFSVLSATNLIPKKGKEYPQRPKPGEVVTVKKYNWNFLQKALCAHVISVTPVTAKGWDYEDMEAPELAVIVSDVKKGIVNFERFFVDLNSRLNIDKFDEVFPLAMKYLKTRINKYKVFVLDSREFYGMGPDSPAGFMREQINLARDCKETIRGGQYILNRSSEKAWLQTAFAVGDLGWDLEWMSDVAQKRKDKWIG